MGSTTSASASGTTAVDPAALLTAARHLDSAADAMTSALDGPLRALRFTGSAAGREHTVSGAGVRAALDGLVADTARWAQTARELAGALSICAQQHGDREEQAGAALR